MASSINLEAITIYVLHSSLKVHLWGTKVLWACNMQAEYMYVHMYILNSSSGAGILVDSAPVMQALWYKMYRIKPIFVLGIINAMMEFKTIWTSSSNLCGN